VKGDIIKVERQDEIERALIKENDDKVRVRLVFLNALANHGISYEEACAICGIHTSTGYVWVRKWNEYGRNGFIDKENVGGRPSKLSNDDLLELKEELKNKEYWTTREVRDKISCMFKKDLSEVTVIRVLRNKLGMHFSKPYPVDYRKPADADILLENQLYLTFKLLKEKGLKDEEIAIGFVDEARPQNTSNTARVWSSKKIRNIKNTTRFKTNTIGFYAIKGNSVQEFIENSKAETISGFLDNLKIANKDYKAIVAIIDNFASHRSVIVRNKAEEIGIYLVFLPPYSPDLNPIELIWRSIKRALSLQFVPDLEQMRKIISEEWNTLSQSMGYAKGWIKRFVYGNYSFILNYS
jgi:putative transposase